MPEPVVINRTLYLGTDQEWLFRKVTGDDNTPVIPTSPKAQIRDEFYGELWAEAQCSVDEDGWISVKFSKEISDNKLWGGRFNGVWDLYVEIDNNHVRWFMGELEVSPNVTI